MCEKIKNESLPVVTDTGPLIFVWEKKKTANEACYGEAQVDLRTQSLCPNVEAAQAEILKSQLPTQLTSYNIY